MRIVKILLFRSLLSYLSISYAFLRVFTILENNMKRHLESGFTLLELLIALLIMGILTAIAVPSYRHYLRKARFAEVVLATSPYKTAVALAVQGGDALPEINNGEKGVPPVAKPTKNLASIVVSKGVVTAKATKLAGGYSYILKPDSEGAQWRVSGTCLKAGVCNE
jgi:type IV pilus assembly protein PilA